MSARITADLGDKKWLKLLKWEAQEKGIPVKEVLVRALEGYFAERLETKALQIASESAFQDWDNPQDSDYDKL